MAQLWGGRFTKETDKLVYDFNASISFDRRFWEQDIRGSIAHVTMLAKQGILTEEEKEQIIKGCLLYTSISRRRSLQSKFISVSLAISLSCGRIMPKPWRMWLRNWAAVLSLRIAIPCMWGEEKMRWNI